MANKQESTEMLTDEIADDDLILRLQSDTLFNSSLAAARLKRANQRIEGLERDNRRLTDINVEAKHREDALVGDIVKAERELDTQKIYRKAAEEELEGVRRELSAERDAKAKAELTRDQAVHAALVEGANYDAMCNRAEQAEAKVAAVEKVIARNGENTHVLCSAFNEALATQSPEPASASMEKCRHTGLLHKEGGVLCVQCGNWVYWNQKEWRTLKRPAPQLSQALRGDRVTSILKHVVGGDWNPPFNIGSPEARLLATILTYLQDIEDRHAK